MLPADEPVEFGAAEEAGYELLLAHPAGATAAELAREWARPEPLIDVLAMLAAIGAAESSDGFGWTARPPDAGLECWLTAQDRDLERARAHAAQLAAAYRAADPGRSAEQVVEVVTGRAMIAERVVAVQRGARQQIRCLDRPPYLDAVGTGAADLDSLARGVRYRAVYDRAALDLPSAVADIERLVAAGQVARVLPSLPAKLYLIDSDVAMLPLRTGPDGVDSMAVIAPGPLFDALSALFDGLWARALPFDLPGGGERRARGGAPDDRRLIALLLAGLTDAAIARQLAIGHRTVQRRVAGLMAAHGARTRFQAGVQIALRSEDGEH